MISRKISKGVEAQSYGGRHYFRRKGLIFTRMENISTRMAKYFSEDEKIFKRGWQNISTRMAKYYYVDGIHQSFQDNHHDEVDESDGDENDNVVNDYVTRIMMVLCFIVATGTMMMMVVVVMLYT